MIVLKATQEKVMAALQSVAGIVERRHTLPILANVLIRKSGGVLQLTTSDLEIQIRTTATLDGDAGDFTTTIGARKLIDILRTMPSDQVVSLESAQSKLILKGGKSKFPLQSMPAEDFPLVQESAVFGPAFSVPQKTLKDLLSQVSFAMANEGVPGALIISKLVEGNYPNYSQVIPKECLERMTLPREEFLSALKRAELMTSEKSNSVKLTFSRNQLAITANTPEVGEAREILTFNYKGKDFAIAFNPIYLMDPLKALETDEIYFELIDELSPGVVKTSAPFLYVIMPMRMS